MATHSTVWTGILSSAATSVSVGDAVVMDTDGYFRVATSANRTTYGRSKGIAITAATTAHPTFEYQVAGVCAGSVVDLGAGAEAWAIVNATGQIERDTTPDSGEDIVGKVDTLGHVQVCPGVWDDGNYAGGSSAVGNANEVQTTDGSGTLQAATNVKAGSSYISVAATPADAGFIRLGYSAISMAGILVRLSDNSGNYPLVVMNDSDAFTLGSNTVGSAIATSSIRSRIGVEFVIGAGGTVAFSVAESALATKATSSSATGNTRCKIYSDIASVQTTDATQTTAYSWSVTDEAVTMVTAEVTVVTSTGAAGATYIRRCRIKRDGGTVTVGSVTDVSTDEDGFNGDVTIDNSGATARVRVTGVAATTADWGCVVTRMEVTHA